MFPLCVLALCFELACVSDLCFGLGGLVFRAGFLFRAWVSVCGFDVWVTRFEFGGFRRLAVGFGVWLWLILWMWVCFVVCCGFVGAAMLVPSGGCVAFFCLFVIGDFVWSKKILEKMESRVVLGYIRLQSRVSPNEISGAPLGGKI